MEQIESSEKAMRLNIKQNFKGEKGYEYTIRADTKEELVKLLADVKDIVKQEGLIWNTKLKQ